MAGEAGALGAHGLLRDLHHHVLAFFHHVLDVEARAALTATTSAAVSSTTAAAAVSRASGARATAVAVPARAARFAAGLLLATGFTGGVFVFGGGGLFPFGRELAAWSGLEVRVRGVAFILEVFDRGKVLLVDQGGGFGLGAFGAFFPGGSLFARRMAVPAAPAAPASPLFFFLIFLGFINDVAYVEESGSFQADVHEGSLHAGKHAHDASLIDVSYDALVLFAVFEKGDSDLGKGGVND
jgi:hypothetical protein